MAQVELDIRTKIAKLQAGLNKTEKQLKDLGTQNEQTNKSMQQNMDRSSKSMQRLTGHLKALLTIGALTALARQIINTRKEFEKFEAMLKVALGSAKEANREFSKIQQFAAETPFSVRELTDSFVRLVNQGFKPTMKEMQAMGDLAAAMGKDFIQLAEAIIDAQVGEFERLKEFGIRASKEGNNIALSFKGVEKQVKFTAEAIQQAIIEFGEMEGVMGTMDEISKTLGGRISNLGDAWDSLMNTMGERTSGILTKVIGGLTEVISKVEELIALEEPAVAGRLRGEGIIKSYIIGVDKDTGEVVYDIGRITDELEALRKELKDYDEASDIVLETWDAFGEQGQERKQAFIDEHEELKAVVEVLEEYTTTIDENTGKKKEQLKTIQDIQDELKGLDNLLKITEVSDIAERKRLETEIELRKDLIKQIMAQEKALMKLVEAQEEDMIALEGWMLNFGNTQENVIGTGIDIWEEYFENKSKQQIESEQEDQRIADNQKAISIALGEARLEAMNSGFEALKALTKENAKANQVIAISQAIINGALQITKIGAQAGVLAPPLQIAAALQTLAQIAIIRQQKFERGGYEVLAGRRHSQGGVNIGIGEAEEGEGVAVFSRQATQKYGKFLPAFVKAMNENEATVTGYGDNAYQIHMDDSRQVNKLEDIRKLLAKEEILYQNGYKIIKRSGHTTKVKC